MRTPWLSTWRQWQVEWTDCVHNPVISPCPKNSWSGWTRVTVEWCTWVLLSSQYVCHRKRQNTYLCNVFIRKYQNNSLFGIAPSQRWKTLNRATESCHTYPNYKQKYCSSWVLHVDSDCVRRTSDAHCRKERLWTSFVCCDRVKDVKPHHTPMVPTDQLILHTLPLNKRGQPFMPR